jgi:hypothetical protein
MSDLMDTYLPGCSPYISKLVYDIDKRILLMECVNSASENVPHTKVTFSGVRSYSEETIDDEYDDHCMDGVVGMNWVKEKVFCIHTEKKEIIIEIENEPATEKIA